MSRAPRLFAVVTASLVFAACGPKTLSQRMTASEKLASETDDFLGQAEHDLQALEVEKARRHLDEARKVLAQPDTSLYPEYEMLKDRLAGDDARLPAVVKAREKRDLDVRVAERRKQMAEAVDRYQKAFDRLVSKDLSRADLAAFDAAAKQFADAIKPDDLEQKSEVWSAEVRSHRDDLDHGIARTGTARARVAFVEGPGAARLAVKPLLLEAQAAKTPEERAAKQAAAVAKLEECSNGKQLIDKAQTLTINPVWLDGKELMPGAVVAGCAKELPAAKSALDKAQAAVAKTVALKKADDERAAAKKKKEEERDAARKKAEDAKAAAEKKKEEARAAAEKKVQDAKDAREAAKKKKEEERDAARKKAEDAKAAAEKKAEEAKAAAEKKKEEAKAAAEKKVQDAKDASAAAKKKQEEEREAARKKADDAREAARKAKDEAKEAAKKKADEAKEATRQKQEEAKQKAEEAKEAAKKKADEAAAQKR